MDQQTANMDDHIESNNHSYTSSAAEYATAEAGPSNYASPPAAPAGRLQALAPVRTSGEDGSSGMVILPAGPNVFTDKQLEEYKEQDRYLPVSCLHLGRSWVSRRLTDVSSSRFTIQIANVGRIMKNSLPEAAKIAKEAKECVQECVSEFISFLVRSFVLFVVLHVDPAS